MKKIKLLLDDSFQELRNLKTLAAAAMLLAITVVLGFYRLQLTDYLRIGFDFIAKELTAMLFGPVMACIVGALSDIISYIIKPIGAFFPGFTISAAVAGLIYGLILYKRPLSLKRIIAANAIVDAAVNLGLNTYWLTVLYGDAFMALLPTRLTKQLITLPIEIVLFYTVTRILSRTKLLTAAGIRS